MYFWYVSFQTQNGKKTKKVKAATKHDAIQKASIKIENITRFLNCELVKTY